MRSDGRILVTYNGNPLSRFSLDSGGGQTQGEGVTAFGGHWSGRPVAPFLASTLGLSYDVTGAAEDAMPIEVELTREP